MNKKLIIGGIVLLLIVVGGGFLLLSQTETKPDLGTPGSDTVPTQWSQAGDYEIKEILGQQTVVTNSKAGFSFKVPEGWVREDREGEIVGEYVFNILSPDAVFQKDESGNEIAMLGGCVISFETEYQKDTVVALSARITSVRDNPSRYERDTSREEIVEVSGNVALKTSLTPPLDSEYYKRFGESIRIELLSGEENVVRFGIRFLGEDKENCLSQFEEFLSNFEM